MNANTANDIYAGMTAAEIFIWKVRAAKAMRTRTVNRRRA